MRRRKYLIETPERAVYSVKRLMGRGVEDIQQELKLFPFRLADDLQPGEVSAHSSSAKRPSRRPRFPLLSCANSSAMPSVSSMRRSQRRSSPCLPTSTTRSGRPRKTQAASPASKFFAWSMNRRPLPSPTGSTRSRTALLPCTTWAAAPSTSRSSNCMTESSRSSPPTAIPIWAAMTLTTC